MLVQKMPMPVCFSRGGFDGLLAFVLCGCIANVSLDAVHCVARISTKVDFLIGHTCDDTLPISQVKYSPNS